MKNNDLQAVKPVSINETNYSADDEISLVDLAMVLVRRKRMIAVITSFIITLGVIAAFVVPKSYTFSTSIEIGSQIIDGSIKPFESPQTLLAKIQHVFIPQVLNEQRQTDTKIKEKYMIKASIPKSSVIIVLEIKGTEDKAGLMTKLLQKVTQQAVLDHKRIYSAVKQNLVALKEQSKAELATLSSEMDNLTERKRLLQRNIEVHDSQHANLRNTREILPPMKSLEPTGTSRKLIVIISAFAGAFLGVFSAFFAEFVAKVREISRQKKD